MFKKLVSVLLAVMMVITVMSVAVVTTGAYEVELDPNNLYFDVSGTGWTMAAKDTIAFHVFGGDVTTAIGWGGKKERGEAVSGEEGLFTITRDKLAKGGITLNDGVQYKIIFVHITGGNPSDQTYDLLFDTTCLGHVGYANGTVYENPVDSSKKALAAFWDGKDNAEYGPVLQISSVGTVIGTCPEEGKTPESIFTNFIAVINNDYKTTPLDNARKYVVNVGTKTEQQLIDDIGAGLGLTKDQVLAAFTDNEVETTWSADASTLPGGETPHEHVAGEPVRENEKPATCTEDGSYDEVVYCTEDGEEMSRETKTIPATGHTPADAVRENEVAATCTAEGSYDEVVYCSVCGAEISRETKTIDKIAHTPGEAVIENEVAADCENAGSYDEVVYCSVCKEELSRNTVEVPALGHTLTFVEEVPATEEANGTKAYYVCSVCGKKFADETASVEVTDADLVIPALPHTHVAGETVIENNVDPDCENAGSYDEVVYCTKCGEELIRNTVIVDALGHEIVFVEEVPATNTENGVKAHYECTRCGKLFADAEGTTEVTAEDLVLKAEHARGDANSDGEVDVLDATTIQRYLIKLVNETFDEVAADADQDGEVDIIDATLIQRVDAGMTTFADWDAKHAA